MPVKNPRKLFVNIPVKDLKTSMTFFEGLGFGFNPQFTDDTAACMVLSDDGYFMLLTEPKFRQFSKKQICDTRTHNEGATRPPPGQAAASSVGAPCDGSPGEAPHRAGH